MYVLFIFYESVWVFLLFYVVALAGEKIDYLLLSKDSGQFGGAL